MRRFPRQTAWPGVLVVGLALLSATERPANAAGDALRDRASAALRTAVRAFRDRVSTEGGYLWRYSEDLSRREGERPATASMVWVQPPGTPTVGRALLDAWRATGETACLDAARDAATALVRGQLRSGGWDYAIEFDPEHRRAWAYRVAPAAPEGQGRNVSTLDDDTTQAALDFLIRFDHETRGAHREIHEAARFALDALLKAQYPGGGWPQRFDGPSDPAAHPDLPASYPETWPRTWPNVDYREYVTLNDNLLPDLVRTLLLAHQVYGDPRYRAAALRVGDFLLKAQMPEPQPIWAQQYDARMHPAWARKFEPPSVTGGESQGAIRLLLRLYRESGDPRLLEPIPRALAFLKAARLPDGRLPRFLELKTNRPLYFTNDYVLTYEDSDLPTHYAFKVGSAIDSIEAEYHRLVAEGPGQPSPPLEAPARPRLTPDLETRARRVVESLDARGLWVEDGRLRAAAGDSPQRVITTSTFIENLGILARYLSAARP